MLKWSYLLPAALLISGCGDAGGTVTGNTSSTRSATQQAAEVVKAYMDNSIQAKKTWGGKRLVVAGELFGAGKNSDGSISILLNTGGSAGVGEFRLRTPDEAYVAGIDKGDEVTLECTVDPENEGFTTTFIDCSRTS